MEKWPIKFDSTTKFTLSTSVESNGTVSSKQDSAITYEWRAGVEALANVMMNFDMMMIEEYNELVVALDKHEYRPNQRSMSLTKNRESPPTRPSIE
ncbi:hypothetical protein H5410_031168 [Solanum commersonii]|uniref:Uncharacterized protein n=1 Tax=Solanum commersonii TaxID=4109 RepID=A0A9J5YLH8_SOLCO|nr:hypothetical protein H5410_031168 [Solanum commersonii]